MDVFTDPEKLQVFLFFVVPGIVALYVRAQFLTGRMPPLADGIVAYVILSLIYHAIILPIYGTVFFRSTFQWKAGAWLLLLFILPASIGALLGLNIRKGWIKGILKKARISTVHPVNAAWDWRFGDCGHCYVLAVLKDGTTWAGYLGPESFMSSDPRERDIFIQQVYEVEDETHKWTPRPSSVWIAHGEIQTLEFWPAS